MKAADPPQLSDAELLEMRARLRRGLVQANTAASLVLLIVLLLASVAIVQVDRIQKSANEARRARAQAREELWKSQAAQARAELASGLAGQRIKALAAITAAAQTQPTPELRNLAITGLALHDIHEDRSVFVPPDATLAVFGPALRRYAAGLSDGQVQVFDTEGSRLLFTLQGGLRPLFLAFSPDGNYLAGRFGGRSRKVWDLRSTNLIIDLSLPPGDLPDTIEFAADSKTVAFSSRDSLLRFCQLPSGEQLEPLDLHLVPRGFSLNPDGRHVAAAWGSRVHIWNLRTGERIQTLELESMAGDLKWHPDGVRLAVGQRNGEIIIFNTYNESSMTLRGHLAVPGGLQFNPQGTLLLSGSLDLTTRLWNVEEGECEWVSRNMLSAGFSGDGRAVTHGHRGRSLGFGQVEEPVVRTILAAPMNSAPLMRSVDFSPDDRLLAAASPNMVLVWDVASRRRVDGGRITDLNTIAFADSSTELITAGANGLMRFGLQTNTFADVVHVIQSRPLDYYIREPVPRLSLAPGTNTWAVCSPGEEPLSLFKLRSPDNRSPFPGHPAGRRVALSPNAQWLATSHEQHMELAVFEALAGKLVFSSTNDGAAVQFSPDGRWLATRHPAHYALLQTGSWKTQATFPAQLPFNANSGAAFSRNGRYFAYTPRHGVVCLGDPRTGSVLAELPSRGGGVIQSLAFNRAGDKLAVATGNRVIELWNLPQLRASLAAMNLDWPEPGTALHPAPVPPLSHHDLSPWRVLVPLFGALVALGFGFYVFLYQRQLVRGYQEVDALVALRNRELEQAQAELLHSQKMKALGTLAAGIAHDFNNLLSVIRLSSDFLRRGTRSQPELVEEVDAIQEAVEKGRQVVHSMLGYSRKQSEAKGPLHLAELVEDTVGLLSRQFLSGIQLVMELDRDAPVVTVPRSRLEQMLLNLIVNASEAMRGQGKLSVTLKPASVPANAVLRPASGKEFVAIIVSDSGPGIPPEIMGRIFEPFFTTKNLGSNPGTGLGLATLYRIAHEEGLGIHVESQPLHGASFSIFIPVPTRAS